MYTEHKCRQKTKVNKIRKERVIHIKGAFNFERAFQNFDMYKYSQEELEFFSVKCVKHFLLSVGMFQYSTTNQKKKMGFTAKELGRLGEYSSQLILGVNMTGGYENFTSLLENFLLLIFEMDISENEISVRKDFKTAIASELRVMTANTMNKNTRYYI